MTVLFLTTPADGEIYNPSIAPLAQPTEKSGDNRLPKVVLSSVSKLVHKNRKLDST